MVHHLNLGRGLIADPAERLALARLNLSAGQKAKSATAHEAALGYLTAGLELVGGRVCGARTTISPSRCTSRPPSAEYLCGNFAEAEQQFSLLLRRAATSLDQARVYRLRSVQYENMSRYARRAGDRPGMPRALRRLLPRLGGGAAGRAGGGDRVHPILAGPAQHRVAGRSAGHDRSGDPDGHEHPDRHLGLDLHPRRAGAGPADLRHHGAPLAGPRQPGGVGLRLRDPRDHRRAGAGGLPVGLRVRHGWPCG